MKEKWQKVIKVLRLIFGYTMLIALLVGGLTFFGYVAAMCIGGETAAVICTFIYKTVVPIMVKVANVMIFFGLVVMYLSGEMELTVGSKKKKEAKKDA